MGDFVITCSTLQCFTTPFGSLLGIQRHIKAIGHYTGILMPPANAIVLEAVRPIRFVVHLSRSIDSYVSVPRFSIGWKRGDPPRLASVSCDRVELNLSQGSDGKPSVLKVYFRSPRSLCTTTESWRLVPWWQYRLGTFRME